MDSEGWDARAGLERVRAGDEDAARALLEHLHPLVAKLVRAHLPQRIDEEDLIQMVFVKVFTKLDQFSGAVPVEHWVSRIAVNTCLSQLHHERARPELRWADLSEEQEKVVQSLAASPDELPASQAFAARELVERLLERLSPADRLVVSLLHLEGRSLEEVGRLTGWSTTLTKVRAFRARQKLRKHLRVLLKEAER
jgi:RNA polymerase sigma-70 factor (ECF subfamily)